MDKDLILQPKKQKFMKILRGYLIFFGLYPSKYLDDKELKWSTYHCKILTSLFPCVFFSEALYIKDHSHASFFEKGHMYVTMFITWMVEVRVIIAQMPVYGNLAKKFFDEVHLSNYQHHDAYSLKVLCKYERYCFLMVIFILGNAHSGLTLFNLTPAYNNWANGAFTNEGKALQSVIYLSLPFDHEYDVTGWLYASVLVVYISVTATLVVVVGDMFMFIIIIHTLGHIDILKHNFRDIERYVKQDDIRISKKDDDEMYILLKRIIEHHNFIIDLLNKITNVYGPILLINYFYESVSCCVLLLELSEGTAESLIRYGPLSIVIFGQLIGVSMVIENLASSIGELSEEVYCTPWALMSVRNQRVIYRTLIVSQNQFKFKALGFIEVSLATMTTILKTSFSYFAFLKTIQE